MPAELPIIPPTLPDDYCFTDWQTLAQDLVGGAVAQLDNSGWSVIIKQSSVPNATQRSYLWFNTDDDKTYRWENSVSKWVSRHPLTPSGSERRLWFGNEASLASYDGGASGTVGDASGPMWEIDTAPEARFLLVAGSLPSGTTIIPGTTGGEEKVTLTTAQLPSHTHTYTGKGDTGAGGDGGAAWVGDGNSSNVSGATGDGESHNNMPPYYGCYVIKRSARIYFAQS